MDLSGKPFPERIVKSAGFGFAAGAVCGSAYHFHKGFRDSHNGHRLAGGALALRMNAPRVGGIVAAWSSVLTAFECALVYARAKEDPLNRILAAAGTGGLLAVRRGPVAAASNAAFSGAIMVIIQGHNALLGGALPPAAPPGYQLPPRAHGLPRDGTGAGH